jgi:two-component system copper resistance phosphate regulon response regulator CusR
MRVLVVEDNPKLAAAVRRVLEEQGWAVDVSGEGHEAEELLAREPYDLVVLDLMLPDRDGVELCRSLRKRSIATPVLMLTSLSSTRHKVDGLDAGADDYLTKPFEFDELVARARALLRRGQATPADRLTYGDLELDLLRRSVQRQGANVQLSAKEFALLEFLVRNAEQVHSRMTISQKVWDMRYEPSSNLVDVYICSLRKKIDRDFTPPLIHTVIGFGYRLGVGASAAR